MNKAHELVRALRRAVYTHRLLTVDQAHRYLDLVGLPRSSLDDGDT